VARDASQVRGARQLAGAVVMLRGAALKNVASSYVGPAAKKIVKANTAETPKFAGTAFLAVTGQEVALLKVRPGRAWEVLARVPRGDVASARVSRGFLRTNLTIGFTDGGRWEFDVSPLVRRTVVRIASALGY
jgi:hypothetical protein